MRGPLYDVIRVGLYVAAGALWCAIPAFLCGWRAERYGRRSVAWALAAILFGWLAVLAVYIVTTED